MKHITYADKSLLVGDEAADLLTEYSAALARAGSADTVTLSAYGADGSDVEGTFVLGQGTVLMAETTNSSIPEPDNTREVIRMREQISQLTSPHPVRPDDEALPAPYDEVDPLDL
jgi:hypothetical protein